MPVSPAKREAEVGLLEPKNLGNIARPTLNTHTRYHPHHHHLSYQGGFCLLAALDYWLLESREHIFALSPYPTWCTASSRPQ